MLMGLIVFLGIIIGAGFLACGAESVANVGATLGNSPKARFSVREENGRTIFAVTPSRTPWTSLIMNGGMLIGALLIFSLMANFEASGSIMAAIFLGLAGVFIFLPVFKAGKTRKPAEIIVDASSLRAGGKTWSARDIADILISNATDLKLPEIVVNAPGQSTSAMMGRAAARRLVERSFVVSLRARTGSDQAIIAGGLTLDIAQALAGDIVEILGKTATK